MRGTFFSYKGGHFLTGHTLWSRDTSYRQAKAINISCEDAAGLQEEEMAPWPKGASSATVSYPNYWGPIQALGTASLCRTQNTGELQELTKI